MATPPDFHANPRRRKSFWPTCILAAVLAACCAALAGDGGPSSAPEPARRLAAAGIAVEVRPAGVTLLDDAGAAVSLWDPAPLEVFDACADPARPFVYLVLGQKGAERGERFAVLAVERASVRVAFLDRDRGYNPWKVLWGDVDGDGEAEVLYCVHKRARYHPVLANRLFVFGWDGQQLYPEWLGSRLSRPFLDAAVRDLDGDGVLELLALEEERDGGRRVMSYRWIGFGFEGDRELARGTRALGLSDFGPSQGGKPCPEESSSSR